MNILSGLKALVTGGDGNTGKMIDTIKAGGDKLFYTDEEKDDYRAKAMDIWVEMLKVVSNESTPRSVNRRVFAWTIILACVVLTFSGITFSCLPFEWSARGYTATKEFTSLFGWDFAMASAVIFYFGPHLATAITQRFSK